MEPIIHLDQFGIPLIEDTIKYTVYQCLFIVQEIQKLGTRITGPGP